MINYAIWAHLSSFPQNWWKLCSARCTIWFLRNWNRVTVFQIRACPCGHHLKRQNEVICCIQTSTQTCVCLKMKQPKCICCFIAPQSSTGELHKNVRGDPPAIPSPAEIQWTTLLLHEAGDMGLDWFPYESNGKVVCFNWKSLLLMDLCKSWSKPVQ